MRVKSCQVSALRNKWGQTLSKTSGGEISEYGAREDSKGFQQEENRSTTDKQESEME